MSKKAQNQKINGLIFRKLFKFAVRTIVQIVEGLRQVVLLKNRYFFVRTIVQIVEGLRLSITPSPLLIACQNHCPDCRRIKTFLIAHKLTSIGQNHCPDCRRIKTMTMALILIKLMSEPLSRL